MSEKETNLKSAHKLALLWTDAQPAVFGYVLSLVKDFTDAEDILQKVALAVVDKFETYDSNYSFQGWAFGIAKNQTRTFQKKKYTDKHVFSDELVDIVADAFDKVESEFSDLHEQLLKCVEQVEGRAEVVLTKCYRDELKPAAIGRDLGISSGNVSVILHRTHQFLKNCMMKGLQA